MTVKHVLVSLAAWHADGRAVGADQFIEPLGPKPSDQLLRVVADRGKGMSALVEFFQVELVGDEHERFAAEVTAGFERTAGWLQARVGAIQAMRHGGVSVRVFVRLWMTRDQMELVVPPSLALACGQAGLAVQVISND